MWLTIQGNATVPMAAPRFPEPFMNPPRMPVPLRVMSMTAAQNGGAATNCKPAAKEKTIAETVLFRMAGAIIQKLPETVMAAKGTPLRPHGLLHLRKK